MRHVDALCGEYLVGTLRGAARKRFERALREEPLVAQRLRHWQAIGLVPGVIVTFVAYQELDDIFDLQLGERTIHVGSEGLAGLRGEIATS